VLKIYSFGNVDGFNLGSGGHLYVARNERTYRQP
jgi:hypothetical protein